LEEEIEPIDPPSEGVDFREVVDLEDRPDGNRKRKSEGERERRDVGVDASFRKLKGSGVARRGGGREHGENGGEFVDRTPTRPADDLENAARVGVFDHETGMGTAVPDANADAPDPPRLEDTGNVGPGDQGRKGVPGRSPLGEAQKTQREEHRGHRGFHAAVPYRM